MKPPLCFICLVSFLVLLLDLQKNSVYSIPNRNIETWMDSIYFCHGGGSSVPDSVAGGGSYCGEIKEPQRYTKVITTSLALQKFVLALAYGARASPLLCPWCWPSTGQSKGSLSTPVCENNLARVQHTMHIKPQISPQWLCWLFVQRVTSVTFSGNCPVFIQSLFLWWNLPWSFGNEKFLSAAVAIAAAPVTAVCLHSTKAEAKKSSRPSLLFPASFPAGDSQPHACCLRLWPSGPGLLSNGQWGTADCQPASSTCSGQCHLMLLFSLPVFTLGCSALPPSLSACLHP